MLTKAGFIEAIEQLLQFKITVFCFNMVYAFRELFIIYYYLILFYLKYRIFCCILNVFTITFDQFNASLLKKSINLFQTNQQQQQKILLTPNFRQSSVD